LYVLIEKLASHKEYGQLIGKLPKLLSGFIQGSYVQPLPLDYKLKIGKIYYLLPWLHAFGSCSIEPRNMQVVSPLNHAKTSCCKRIEEKQNCHNQRAALTTSYQTRSVK